MFESSTGVSYKAEAVMAEAPSRSVAEGVPTAVGVPGADLLPERDGTEDTNHANHLEDEPEDELLASVR